MQLKITGYQVIEGGPIPKELYLDLKEGMSFTIDPGEVFTCVDWNGVKWVFESASFKSEII